MVIVPLTAVVDVTHIIHYTICSETNFKPEIAMLFTINFFLLSLNLYSLLCVVSQYQEYKAGRGRAADEDNLLRAAAVRYLAQPTATSGLSTRRGTHTTVHDGHSPSADRAATNGGLRLAVPPPPYSRRPAAGGGAVVHAGGLSHHSVRKHVQFPDMSTARVVLDEDSSPEDSPGKPAPTFSGILVLDDALFRISASVNFSTITGRPHQRKARSCREGPSGPGRSTPRELKRRARLQRHLSGPARTRW
ncbi:hypothetical protein ONE63_009902 [Megalurothrips usitatus]|uniref:Uncharacterized protein n=1 Tax=Megalurothrips usitatus TaxID=439358 RepID=A0AAV7XG43_9NEOP|nr:hypothetical protein ONE63_009902 [Megalurothrips usitatus]